MRRAESGKKNEVNGIKQEVDSKGKIMHVEMSDL